MKRMNRAILFLVVNISVTRVYAMPTDIAGAFQEADAEFNRVYQELLKEKRADPVGLEKLKSAETAWIKFRDAQCEFYSYSMGYESADRGGMQLCKSTLTLERTKQLEYFLGK